MKKRVIALLLAACLAAGGESTMVVYADAPEEGVIQEQMELPGQGEVAEEMEDMVSEDIEDIEGTVEQQIEDTTEEKLFPSGQEEIEEEKVEKEKVYQKQYQENDKAEETELQYVDEQRGANLKTSSDGQWEYYLEYGKATVESYLGNATTVTVPSKIDGATVIAISEYYKNSIKGITSLTLPNTISSLPEGCFSGCEDLRIITLSNKITSVSDSCFSDCSSLTTIKNYEKVICLEKYAFLGCKSLREFNFSNIKTIGELAFDECSSLTKISLPSEIKSIPNDCFRNCSSLKTVILRKGLEEISLASFKGCSSLESISFPSTLVRIGDWAFENCVNLTSVTIPTNIKDVGGAVFKGCTNLEYVAYDSASGILWQAFNGCISLRKIEFCNEVIEIGNRAFEGCVSLTSITIPEITQVSDSAFESCELLSAIYGVKGSPAETFAKNHGILFKQLKKMSGVKVSKVSNKICTGKAITPAVTLKLGNKKLKAGTDYVLAYKSNKNIGRAHITITGKGDYIGEQVIFFNIVPPKITVKKLESKKKGSLTVTVNKSKGARGYVIAYSTRKSGGYKKVYTTKTKTTINGLKSGKKYYVKVTPYTVILARKQSPPYSSVKIKKVR